MFEQRIMNQCPSCGSRSLFLGFGGHLTCSVIGCKEPIVDKAMDKLKAAVERLTDSNKLLEFNNTELGKICEKHMQIKEQFREALESVKHCVTKGLCDGCRIIVDKALKGE